MKKRLICFVFSLYVSFAINAQVITSIAGNGAGGDGSFAIMASIYDPSYFTFDSYGNLFFSEGAGHKVRKVDTAGIITTIAGTGTVGYSGDNGPATDAQFNQVADVVVDRHGNIFISDVINNRIRKVDVNGIITSIAGNGVAGYGGDGGPASAAALYMPSGLCFDKYGNLYIGDYGNHRIRKIDTDNIITTAAGSGSMGWGGNGGPATDARISPSADISIDALGNLYIAEWTYKVVRKIDVSGIISIVAGDTSDYLYNGNNIPATSAHMSPFSAVVSSNGELYISDNYNNIIRMVDAMGIIHTVAGTGVGGNTGDGGPATAATIHTPSGLAVDSCGNVYFGQVNTPRIRKILFNPPCWPMRVTTVGEADNISVYPNPVYDELHIDNIKPQASYCLLSIVGTVLQHGLLTEGSNIISLRSLPAGVYMVKLICKDGEKLVKKFIKQ